MSAAAIDWRDALFVVQVKTFIRWQRAGWRLFWRWKCRPGRPRIPVELRALIRRMAQENPGWGEERIASELLVKLGIRVSPRTVRKYMPKPAFMAALKSERRLTVPEFGSRYSRRQRSSNE